MLLPKAYETAFGVHRLKALRNHYVDTAFQVGLHSNVILVPIGIILNILSFVIFYQIKTHKSATGLHLMCMAIADNFALVAIFLNDVPAYSIYSFIPDIHALHNFFCKSISIFLNGSVLWCGLLPASATVERFICVSFALKVKSWNLLKLSKLLLIAYFLLSFCLNILYLAHHIVNVYNVKTCIVFPDGTGYLTDLIVNGILSNVVVLSVILFFTVAIAIHLYRYKKQRNDLSQNISNGENKEFMITAMLFTVACLFLVTKIPIVIVSEIGKNIQPEDYSDFEIFRHLLVALVIGTLLRVISNSTNLIIYVIFFKEFRDTFVDFCTNRVRNVNGNKQSPSD